MDNILNIDGLERFFACDKSTTTIAHHVTISTSTKLLKQNVVAAFMCTIQRHPRMRFQYTNPSEHKGTILPSLSSESIASIVEVKDEECANWQSFVTERCNIPQRLQNHLYFSLSIFIINDHKARVILFSDHCLADGMSGMIILNDFFKSLVELQTNAEFHFDPLQVQPSIYSKLKAQRSWARSILTSISTAIGGPFLKHDNKRFKPVYPLANTLHELALPTQFNKSTCIATSGSSDNLNAIIQRCKQAKVTVHGGIAAAMYTVTAAQLANSSKECKVKIDVDINMRDRLQTAMGKDHVGLFIIIGTLTLLHEKGIDLKTSFWESARKLKQNTDETVQSPLSEIVIEYIHHKSHTTEQLVDLFQSTKYGIDSDINLSNIGRYPFPLKLYGKGDSTNEPPALAIEDLHVHNNIPLVGPTAIFFITTTDKLHYTLSHQWETAFANTFFKQLTTLIENLCNISEEQSIEDVISSFHFRPQNQ